MDDNDKPTSRERMQAVLCGVLPDRVPFFPTIYIDHACVACGRQFEEALVNPALGQECMLAAARRYGADAVRFSMGPDASWYEDTIVEHRDGKLQQISRRSGRTEGYYDVKGGGDFIPLEKPAAVAHDSGRAGSERDKCRSVPGTRMSERRCTARTSGSRGRPVRRRPVSGTNH